MAKLTFMQGKRPIVSFPLLPSAAYGSAGQTKLGHTPSLLYGHLYSITRSRLASLYRPFRTRSQKLRAKVSIKHEHRRSRTVRFVPSSQSDHAVCGLAGRRSLRWMAISDFLFVNCSFDERTSRERERERAPELCPIRRLRMN